MLTSFVEVIPVEDKKTETVIKAYIKYVYADKGGSKFILTDRGGKFSSEAMIYITEQLGFTKVYTSLYSPKSNSLIERCHSFLKSSLRKMRFNHDAEWDELVHIAKMAYNIVVSIAIIQMYIISTPSIACVKVNHHVVASTQNE